MTNAQCVNEGRNEYTSHERAKSKAPVSQLVNAEVNSGNRVKSGISSNYATRILGRHPPALRECTSMVASQPLT